MKISLVVPVYNEEESVELFYQEVRNKLKDYEVEIVFINDGSKDNTETLIETLAKNDVLVKSYSFTRNFGKEPALFAGLTYATGDAIIPIDVDLQDPIEVIPEMIEMWQNGADIVLAKRSDRSSDSYLKKLTASLFYKLHNTISHLKIEENVGDFRLLDKSIVKHILTLPERNLFMKGILSFVGGNVKVIEYKREERSAGKTKFSGWKLWNLALEGITSFSTVPLKIWTYLGLFVATLSFAYGFWIIFQKIIFDTPIPGYPSILVSILFLGGIQLIGIGILGEYIGRIYIEAKQRPRFIIKSTRNKNDN